ncbi:hypothetical protein AB0D74_45255 [Streptomyces sp. NPDC048278]|uniref:hypothetical protein n=1 Tax=Streptomyces sp. NPDC048278 TaxID=3155809 RepID=UPI00343CF47B
MSSTVRIAGALPTPDADPSLSVVFAGGWSVGYDWAADHVVTAGAPTQPLFPAPFDRDLDGALLGQQAFSDFEYVFQGGNYQRIKLVGLQPDGDPASTADNWFLPSEWTTLDAVFPGGGVKSGFAYFFHGPDYMRFDWPANAASAGYPKPIGPNWHTSGDFTHDLDGEITGLRAFGTKAYLFRTVTTMVNRDGRRVSSGGFVVNVPVYCRYDFDHEVVDNTVTDPADVVGQWNGLFPLLDAGPAIELALDWIGRAETAAAATPLDPATLTAFAHHFMTGSPDTTVVNTVRDRLRQIRERLTALPDQFKWTAALGFAAVTTPGTLTEIGNEFSTFHGPNGRAAALIHEASHFRFDAGVDVPEWSSEVVAGVQQSPAVINGVTMPRYSTIPTADALVNPSSYAAFAQETALGEDTRFGAARTQL